MPASLAANAVGPGDPQYERVRHTYSRTGSPALVLRPSTAEEVSEAVRYARAQGVDISVRSGGHGISGRSTNDGGVVIDLARMNKVTVLDRAAGRVRLEPGARWGNVAKVLAADGLAMSSGDYGDVGGGAVNDVPADRTAYPHRHQNFSVLAGTVSQKRRQLDTLWSELRKHLDGMYLSFETGTEPELLLEAFPEPALTRLRELKGRYDPDNVFNRNFPIPPLAAR